MIRGDQRGQKRKLQLRTLMLDRRKLVVIRQSGKGLIAEEQKQGRIGGKDWVFAS